MTSIWSFLLQTLTVSLAAALLLLVKYLLQDKLSPRWQYGVWGLLALRLLLPVAVTGRYALLPLPLWVETSKALAESALSSASSAFSAPYVPLGLTHVFPYLPGPPRSVTDWLFVLYLLGVLAVLLSDFARYFRLRLRVRRGDPVPSTLEDQITRVCARYSLKACPAVTVPGLSTAVICGCFRPILALPAGKPVDENILLHELLHLQSRDAAQSVLWRLFRALHWCNPFLQFVFNRIGCDMESFCDQRALERLEGEERRAYGDSLPGLTNETSPRVPGTTFLSSGGAQISRRRAAIDRFPHYPRGMALASLCMAVILASSLLWGIQGNGLSDVEQGPPTPALSQGDGVAWNFHRGLAITRIYRPSTVAGALDTYAKGLFRNNAYYLAAASPLEQQEYWVQQMERSENGRSPCYQDVDPGAYLYWNASNLNFFESLYQVYSLTPQEDGSYTALLTFSCNSLVNPETHDVYRDEEDVYQYGWLVLPVRVFQDHGWVVEPLGPMAPNFSAPDCYSAPPYLPGGTGTYPLCRHFTAQGASGTVDVWLSSYFYPNEPNDNAKNMGSLLFGSPSFDQQPNLHVKTTGYNSSLSAAYTFSGSQEERDAMTYVGLSVAPDSGSRKDPAPEDLTNRMLPEGMSDNSEKTSYGVDLLDQNNSLVLTGGSAGWSSSNLFPIDRCKGFHAQIYWNGQLKETLYLEEVPHETES